jgi:hypothetical protein
MPRIDKRKSEPKTRADARIFMASTTFEYRLAPRETRAPSNPAVRHSQTSFAPHGGIHSRFCQRRIRERRISAPATPNPAAKTGGVNRIPPNPCPANMEPEPLCRVMLKLANKKYRQ